MHLTMMTRGRNHSRRLGALLLALAAAGALAATANWEALHTMRYRAMTSSDLQGAAARHPRDPLLVIVAGERLLADGRAGDARAMLLPAASVHPRNADIQVLAARAVWQAGDARQAARMLEKAVEVDPRNVEAYHLLGEFMYARGYADNAAKLWEHAVGIDPTYGPAWRRLGERSLKAQRYAAAVRQLDRAEKLAPSGEGARLRAAALKSAGRLADARRSAESAVRRDRSAASYMLLGELVQLSPGLAAQRDAQPHFLRAVELEPSAPNLRRLAVNHRALGEHPQAVRALRRMLRETPGASEGYLLLGQSYQALGKQALADVCLRAYHRLDPLETRVRRAQFRVDVEHGTVASQLNLARVYVDVGREDLARKVLQRVRERAPNDKDVAALMRRARGGPSLRIDPLPPDPEGDSR